MQKHITKIVMTLCLLIAGEVFIQAPAFAVDEYVSAIYQKIDTAFDNRSDKELNSILEAYNKDPNYDLVEFYTMKKIRRLMVTGDFKLAQSAVLVVIDNNLDNTEAVDMYTTVSESVEKQESEEQLAAEKQKQDNERIVAAKEKARISLEKEVSSTQTASGDTVYLGQKEDKYSSSAWNIGFGMCNLMYIAETPDDYTSLRYGLSVDYRYEYTYESLIIGVDSEASVMLLKLINDDKSMLGDVKIAPEFGYKKWNNYLRLRGGFAALINGNKTDSCVLQETFLTPLIGVGMNGIKLGTRKLSGYYDYYFGHFSYDNLRSAMGARICLSSPIATLETIQLNFNIGLKDNLLIKDNGIENKASLVFAIGVENVTK